MAGPDTGQERTHQATDKRLADARRKGDVPRSRELNTVVMMLASMLGFALLGSTGVGTYKKLSASHWALEREDIFSDQGLLVAFQEFLTQAFLLTLPFLLVMFLAVFVGPLFMGGWVFSSEGFSFKLSKVNPLSGLKRMFGMQSVAELVKALLKVMLLGGVALLLLQNYQDDFLGLAVLPVPEAINHMFGLVFTVILTLMMTLGLVALVDVPYQKWSYARKLRMTLQEIKEESKEQQVNPEVKAKARQMAQSQAQRRSLADVPDADVIIVNPTHFSVALKYDDDHPAPIVLAKGVDFMALRIREIARDSDIPVFRAPPLARALYRHTEIGETIPSELYLAVAQVLAYVLQVRKASFAEQRRMVPPTDLPVPKDFRDPEDS